ncbi:MAG: tetratricopeptide repeat protein, partial [Moorea sp. SIO3I7]|nr:tetratricopeptide repeat protein [Moorena sp. SIO3I7]
MGGLGKTELALQYALRYQDKYRGGLCWLQVRRADLGTQLVSFGRRDLGLTIPDELEFNDQVRYCWRNWPEGTVLIVLDDVLSFGNDYKQRIEPYLPPAQSRFKVLVTSRQRPGASYRRIDLDVLSPEAALELFRSLVGKERIDKELTEAEALCEWLGYLPLGLELVGRYLDLYPSSTIAKVQKHLEQEKLAAKALLYPTEQGKMTAPLDVATALDLSWNDLPPKAQQLGCHLSLFAPAPFEWSLVEACIIQAQDQEEWGKAQEELEELCDRFLVNPNMLALTENKTYRLHPLIREFFQTKLAQLPEADSYKQSFCQAMAAKAKEIPKTPTRDQIAAVTPAIPHLAEAATVFTNWIRDEDLLSLFTGLGRFYEGQGSYNQAERWWELCLDITISRLGEKHPDVGTSLNHLAEIYFNQGRYDQAQSLYVKALELRKELLGEEHPDVAETFNDLAVFLEDQGLFDRSESFFLKALEIRKTLLSEDHPDLVLSLNNLGRVYGIQERYDQAKSLLDQALEMTKKLLSEDHPYKIYILNNLGALYSAQGDYHQAEDFYHKALEIARHRLSEKHPHVAHILNNLANLYNIQGQYDQAEPLLLQALDIIKPCLGKKYPHVAHILNGLGNLYNLQGQYDQAETFYQQALKIRQHWLGEQHPHIAESLNRLADLYYSQEQYDQAETFYQQALKIRQHWLGEQHPHIAESLNRLADLYYSQEQYDQAETFYMQALEMRKGCLG